ncbi:Septal ring factor EnvC, activator of murein hydrolases AmiA and AmiB [Amphritea atlantica]|uniref:Septal ring factor EnvC, activator of murein hydrolases AmiA and AmiB n=1 Tax=Amphritea atlantica TaxID=355243 RepID=A0A1H9JDE0_9GAMM|nr:peptidoglycan DD-metalloendopeptidase family protein [Amphritea atlantica]SEQ84615.1 Septal ring factor EnvC, activator of murein hydrolases AmiA and AmiB [Amphritea atlantica]
MPIKLRTAVIVSLVSTLLLLPGQALYAVQEKATEKEIVSLRKSIAKLTQTLGALEGERSSVQQALRRTDKNIGELAREILRLNTQLKGAEQRLAKLEQQKKPLLAGLQKQAAGLEQQLRQQYKAGHQPRLQLLLNQRDPEQVSRMLHYYDRINKTLSERLESFRQGLEQLDRAEQEIRSAQQDIFDRRDLLKARSDDLESVRQERRVVLSKLESRLNDGGQQLKSMQADQRRLEKLLAQIRESIEKISIGGDERSFKELKGKLPWPAQGRVSRRFGSQRDGIRYEGILVEQKAGQPVRAIHHGRVVFSDWLRGYGLLTIVDHGGGYMSLYGHNESLLREVGEWVSAGDQLATVGNSGGSNHSGLYFAVRYKGNSTDPLKWLARR